MVAIRNMHTLQYICICAYNVFKCKALSKWLYDQPNRTRGAKRQNNISVIAYTVMLSVFNKPEVYEGAYEKTLLSLCEALGIKYKSRAVLGNAQDKNVHNI